MGFLRVCLKFIQRHPQRTSFTSGIPHDRRRCPDGGDGLGMTSYATTYLCKHALTQLAVGSMLYLSIGACKSNALAPFSEYSQSDEQQVYTATKRGEYAAAMQIIDSHLDRHPKDGLFYKLKANLLLIQNTLSLREVYLGIEEQKAKDKKEKVNRDDIGRLLLVTEPMTPERRKAVQDVVANYKKAIEYSPGDDNLESTLGEQHALAILALTAFPPSVIDRWKDKKKIDATTAAELKNDLSFTNDQADLLIMTFDTQQDKLLEKVSSDKVANIKAEVDKIKTLPGATNRERIIEYLKQRGEGVPSLPK